MTSTVEVKRSEAGGREVYSISKTYRGEEHEVIFPLDQDVQVLVNLISTINKELSKKDQFVLMRRNAVGQNGETSTDIRTVKLAVLQSVIAELFNANAASFVKTQLEKELEIDL